MNDIIGSSSASEQATALADNDPKHQIRLNDAMLLLGAAMDIFENGKSRRVQTSTKRDVSPVTTTVSTNSVKKRIKATPSSYPSVKNVKIKFMDGLETQGNDSEKTGNIESCLLEPSKNHKNDKKSERRSKVDKWLKKRARMIANQKKNALKKKSRCRYVGRTKFAMSRRRVKGRFVSLKFLNDRGIKFDSNVKPEAGWVCSTLGGKVFLSLEDAMKAVDNYDDTKSAPNSKKKRSIGNHAHATNM